MSLEIFDFALNLWVDGIPPSHAKKLIDSRNPHLIPELYSLFRRFASDYVTRMIKPYLKLPGPLVELDETHLG